MRTRSAAKPVLATVALSLLLAVTTGCNSGHNKLDKGDLEVNATAASDKTKTPSGKPAPSNKPAATAPGK